MNVETPALVVDLERLRSNIATMSGTLRSRGLRLRPHAKTHKCVEIAALQRDAGADGLTVATLSEAEVFAEAGFTDLLVAYPVFPVGAKAARLRGLLDTTALHVGVDNLAGATAVARAAEGRLVSVLLEVDSGQHRTGVAPPAVIELAERCDALGLRVSGVFTHGGHAYASPEAPGSAAQDEGRALATATDALRGAGFDITVVSAGSTPTAGEPRPPHVTEERPGTYVFHDRQQLALGACAPEEIAVSVAATVVSTAPGRYVLDAGSKALGMDRPEWLSGHGAIGPEATVTRLSEHHAVVEGAGVVPEVGEVVHVTPNHVCNVVNLFEEYVVVEDGEVVDRWRVAARGRNA